ncbi:MAG: hypothetical protein ACKVU4_02480 [Phycisphaerales bacterium]
MHRSRDARTPPRLIARSTPGRAVVFSALVAVVIAGLGGCSTRDETAAVSGGTPVVCEFGGRGMSPGRLAQPRAIDADDRSVWVIDKSARVQRLEPATGGVLASWTMPDYALGKPTGVTIAVGPRAGADGGPEQGVYIPDTHYHRVMVYAAPPSAQAEPELLASFGSFGTDPGEFIYPTDVAVLPAADGWVERVYVSEYGGNDRVSVFDAAYRFLFSFGVSRGTDAALAAGPDAVEFDRPQSIALDVPRRRLIVADACDHRLGVFDLDGRLVRWIGSRETGGREPGRFNYPYGLALCPDGTVLVAEFGNHRVQRIDVESGASLGVFGAMGRGHGQVLNPWGVALIGPTAYVLDTGNCRVLGLDLSRAARLADGGAAR